VKNNFKTAKKTISTSDSALSSLFHRAQIISDLSKRLSKALDEDLQTHCRLINFRKNSLIFEADSPVWANKLKLSSVGILQIARHFCKVNADYIRITVNPDPNNKPEKTVQKRSLSPQVSDTLKAAASICSDPELAEQMRRLAAQTSQS